MTFWIALAVKVVASALIVVLASVAAEAAGPFWGGLIITLPISSGPAYVLLSLQHDAIFIADSALSSFAANAATFVLLTVFALLAPRHRRSVVIGRGVAAWLLGGAEPDGAPHQASERSALRLGPLRSTRTRRHPRP